MDFSINLPVKAKKEDISLKIDAPDSVEAPVNKGDILGKAEVFYLGQKVGEFNVVSDSTFKKSYILMILKSCEYIVKSPVFIVLVIISIAFLVIYVMIAIRENKKRRRRNKVKKFPKHFSK